jgi:hypothetical protein
MNEADACSSSDSFTTRTPKKLHTARRTRPAPGGQPERGCPGRSRRGACSGELPGPRCQDPSRFEPDPFVPHPRFAAEGDGGVLFDHHRRSAELDTTFQNLSRREDLIRRTVSTDYPRPYKLSLRSCPSGKVLAANNTLNHELNHGVLSGASLAYLFLNPTPRAVRSPSSWWPYVL